MNNTKLNLIWESFDDYYRRARIPGGWLLIFEADVTHNLIDQGRGFEAGFDWRPAMCFIPDPNYEWKLNDKPIIVQRVEAPRV